MPGDERGRGAPGTPLPQPPARTGPRCPDPAPPPLRPASDAAPRPRSPTAPGPGPGPGPASHPLRRRLPGEVSFFRRAAEVPPRDVTATAPGPVRPILAAGHGGGTELRSPPPPAPGRLLPGSRPAPPPAAHHPRHRNAGPGGAAGGAAAAGSCARCRRGAPGGTAPCPAAAPRPPLRPGPGRSRPRSAPGRPTPPAPCRSRCSRAAPPPAPRDVRPLRGLRGARGSRSVRGARPWGWGSAGTALAMASLLPLCLKFGASLLPPCLKFGVCLPSWPRAPPPCPDPLRAPVGVCGAAQPKGQAGRGETPQTHSSGVLPPHLGEMGRQAACEPFQCCWKRLLCCHCGDKLTRCPALLCCTNAALATSRTPPLPSQALPPSPHNL